MAAAGGVAGGLGNPLLGGAYPDGENNHQGNKLLPLDEQCFRGFLSKVADGAVMGLVTLNIFFATYLLAWGRPGTRCIPGPTTTTDSSGKSVTITYIGWIQVVVGSLPFLVLPFTVFAGGLVKASDKGRCGLGLVAGLVLFEAVFGLMMGGTMMFCATDYYHWCVPPIITVVLCILATVVWGFSFREPKLLYRVLCFGLRRQPAPRANTNAQANANAQAALAQANAIAQAALVQANAIAQAALAQANANAQALDNAQAALAQVNANALAQAIAIAQALAHANANPAVAPLANDAIVQEFEAAANNG